MCGVSAQSSDEEPGSAQTEQLFAGTDYTIETVTAYELDTSIALPAVPESSDDRTGEMVAFLKQSGVL